MNNINEIIKEINSIPKYDKHTIFNDVIVKGSLEVVCGLFSNTEIKLVDDLKNLEQKYTKEELDKFNKILGLIQEEIGINIQNNCFKDVLGGIFNLLEIKNKNTGQFFTPEYVSELIAKLICTKEHIKEDIKEQIKYKPYIALHEPSCGAGGMILAYADVMAKLGYNPQRQLFIDCSDIDFRCVCMTYLQLTYYGLPAIVRHQDTLTKKMWSIWPTIIYLKDYWGYRIKGIVSYEPKNNSVNLEIIKEE